MMSAALPPPFGEIITSPFPALVPRVKLVFGSAPALERSIVWPLLYALCRVAAEPPEVHGLTLFDPSKHKDDVAVPPPRELNVTVELASRVVNFPLDLVVPPIAIPSMVPPVAVRVPTVILLLALESVKAFDVLDPLPVTDASVDVSAKVTDPAAPVVVMSVPAVKVSVFPCAIFCVVVPLVAPATNSVPVNAPVDNDPAGKDTLPDDTVRPVKPVNVPVATRFPFPLTVKTGMLEDEALSTSPTPSLLAIKDAYDVFPDTEATEIVPEFPRTSSVDKGLVVNNPIFPVPF